MILNIERSRSINLFRIYLNVKKDVYYMGEEKKDQGVLGIHHVTFLARNPQMVNFVYHLSSKLYN